VKDTLLNEYGKVFDGAANDHRTIMWYYGHFREVWPSRGTVAPRVLGDRKGTPCLRDASL
jgi:hypothetical protein